MELINNLPLVTDFPSSKQWEAAVWEILLERLAQIKSAAELKKVLDFLLSPHERHNVVFRALTASRVKSGIGFREIGRELWLASDTISAIKKSFLESEYKSSRLRGHTKRAYTVDAPQHKKRTYVRKFKGAYAIGFEKEY